MNQPAVKFIKIFWKQNLSLGYEKIIRNYYFMQDGATPQTTEEAFERLFEVFCNRVIRLGYPKLANGGMEWRLYSLELQFVELFHLGLY